MPSNPCFLIVYNSQDNANIHCSFHFFDLVNISTSIVGLLKTKNDQLITIDTLQKQ